MNITIKTVTILFLFFSFIFSETNYYSDYNRSIYSTPRSRALGESDLAITTDATPNALSASIAKVDGTVIYAGYTGFYQNLFGATTLFFTTPIDTVQSVGASLSYMMIPGVDSVSATDNGSGIPLDISIQEKTSSEIYFNMNYGRKIKGFDKVSLYAGGAIHFKRVRLIDWTGYGIGADVSFLSSFNNGINVALKMNNFFTEYTYWSGKYKENGLPRIFFAFGFDRDFTEKFGLAVTYKSPDLFGNSGVGGNAFSTDGQFSGEPIKLSVRSNPQILFTAASYGTEFLISKIVSLRAGFSDTHMLSFGGGVKLFKKWDIDFVYTHSNSLEGTYSLGTKVLF